jgi:hypothetical protein
MTFPKRYDIMAAAIDAVEKKLEEFGLKTSDGGRRIASAEMKEDGRLTVYFDGEGLDTNS